MHYQGKAQLITSEEEIKRLKARILSQDAPFRKFMDRPDVQFFRVKPRIIYYTDSKRKFFCRDVLHGNDTAGIIDIDIRNEKIVQEQRMGTLDEAGVEFSKTLRSTSERDVINR